MLISYPILFKDQITDLFSSSKLLPQPEAFTELSFSSHQELPQIITPDKIETFGFTIHNLENQDKTYPYIVYVNTNNTRQQLDNNTVTLKNNESITIIESFIFSYSAPRSEVVVELTEKHQSIHFWVEGQ